MKRILKQSLSLLLAIVLVMGSIVPAYAKVDASCTSIENTSITKDSDVKSDEQIERMLKETVEPARTENSTYEPITVLSLLQYGDSKEEVGSKAAFKSRWSKTVSSLSIDILIAKSLNLDIENYQNTNLLDELGKKELKSVNNLEQFIWTILAYEKIGFTYDKSEAKNIFNTQYEKNKDTKYKAMALFIVQFLEDGELVKEEIVNELKDNQLETGEVINVETTSYLINGLLINGIEPNEWKHENGNSLVDGLINLYMGDGKFKATQADKWGRYSEINFAALVALRDGKSPFTFIDEDNSRLDEVLNETHETAIAESSNYEPTTVLSLVQYGDNKQDIAAKASVKSKWMKNINNLAMDILVAKSLEKNIESYQGINLLEEINKKQLSGVNNLGQFIWTILGYENIGLSYDKSEAQKIFNTQYEKNNDSKYKAMTLLIVPYLEDGAAIKESILNEFKMSQSETGEVINAETTSYLINGLLVNDINPYEWKHENGTNIADGFLNLYRSDGKFGITQADKYGRYYEINLTALVALRDGKTPFIFDGQDEASYNISLSKGAESPVRIRQGEETQVPITIMDKNNKEVDMETIWSSQSEKLTIVGDKLLGLDTGEARVKIELKGYPQFFLEFDVLIEPANLTVSSVEILSSSTNRLVLGNTGKIDAISKDKNGILVDDNYIYSTYPEGILTVDSNGNLNGIKEGNAVVTVVSQKDSTISNTARIYVYSSVEDSENTIDDFVDATIGYYKKGSKNLIALETKVLTRAGVDLKGWNANTNVFQRDYQKNSLSSMAKQVEVLLEIGGDPTNYQERNLVQEIYERVGVENQNEADSVYIDGLNGLFSYHRENPDKIGELDYRVYKENLLKLQSPNGSFKTASITGDALVVLSQLPQDDEVKLAIESALSFLKSNQKSDGSITTTVAFTDVNAKIIRGLLAVGEDPTGDKWSVGDTNLVEALFLFFRDDKGFDDQENSSPTGGSWVTATHEALDALLELRDRGYGGYVVKKQNAKEVIKEDKTIDVEIVILSGNKPYNFIFKPQKVKVNTITNSSGLTPIGALESTKVPFTNAAGYISEIAGLSAQGLGGWKYSVNDVEPIKLPLFYELEDGDKVVWYYVSNYDVKIPEWSDIISVDEAVDKDALNEVISETEGKVETDYTPESWIEFEDALTKAKEVAGKDTATKEEIEDAKTALENAIDALVPVTPQPGVVDKTDLTNIIDRAERVNKDKYTSSTVRRLEDAIESARSVLRDDNATQTEVNAAESELRRALNALEEIDNREPNYNGNLNWLIFGDGSENKKDEVKPETKPEVKPEMVDIVGHWAEIVIKYVVEKEYFNGIDSTHFAPNQAATRGEFITVLGRLAKVDQSKYSDSKASDVNSSSFYSEYANWAISEGIVSGYEDGTFRGDQTLTREEMAVFLNNTLKFMNRSLVETEVASFADESNISKWAVESIKMMTANGYLKGRDGNAFDPKAELTRAEIAQIIYNVDTK